MIVRPEDAKRRTCAEALPVCDVALELTGTDRQAPPGKSGIGRFEEMPQTAYMDFVKTPSRRVWP